MTNTNTSPSTQSVSVWNQQLKIQVRVAGSGPSLVYLHPAGGLAWDPFLESLSRRYTVYAPEHPGTSASDPSAINKVDSWWELMLMYEELIRALRLEKPIVIGPSYGGMMAADLASLYPDLFSKLVLLDAIGLWRDDARIPLVELSAGGPEQLAGYLFHNPDCQGARAMFAPGPDPEAALKAMAGMVWSLGCTGKFFWPIADYGLAKRLHRVRAPTLIIWGEQDALVPVVYADEFAKRIGGSQVALIGQCGHIPQVEQTAQTLEVTEAFLSQSR